MADRFNLTFLTAGAEVDQAIVAAWLQQRQGSLIVANDNDLAWLAGFGTTHQHGGASANHGSAAAGRIRLTTSFNGTCFSSINNNEVNTQRYVTAKRDAQQRMLHREPQLAAARAANTAAQVRQPCAPW